ncbi:hypothetical protein COLO4_03475 [Corchorus olitorius]|uniref:C2 domain-containing protein n=1 Tax=Corchorus olitorius TaxID=93759 RepID=A0A1R3KYD0_9ROSI|nr:hypothetical protein COLO4_03475 [Corchorus olitorius]
MSPSSRFARNRKYRILEIKSLSLELDHKVIKSGRVYVKLWTHPDRQLRTSVKCLSQGCKAVWDDKLIVLVPDNFLMGSKNKDKSSNNNILWFKLFMSRKYLKDTVLGTAFVDLNSLFHDHHQQDKDDSIRSSQFYECYEDEDFLNDPVYDEEEEEEEEEEYFLEDPRYENMFKPKYEIDFELSDDQMDANMMEAAAAPAAKKKNVEIYAIRKKKNIIPGGSVSLNKELERKGMLRIEVGDKEGYIHCIGDHKWRKSAMSYDQFMGLINPPSHHNDKNIIKRINNLKGNLLCFKGSI